MVFGVSVMVCFGRVRKGSVHKDNVNGLVLLLVNKREVCTRGRGANAIGLEGTQTKPQQQTKENMSKRREQPYTYTHTKTNMRI